MGDCNRSAGLVADQRGCGREARRSATTLGIDGGDLPAALAQRSPA